MSIPKNAIFGGKSKLKKNSFGPKSRYWRKTVWSKKEVFGRNLNQVQNRNFDHVKKEGLVENRKHVQK